MELLRFILGLLMLSAVGRAAAPIARPDIKAWPLAPEAPHTPSPPRDPSKVCYVKPSSAAGSDDSPAILQAFRDCNSGGTVVLDANYTIASPLDLTFLQAVDVAISGTINFSKDINYWVNHSFKISYQNSSAFWRFGGRDVNIFGGGTGLINGNGQPWYDAFAKNQTLLRPILLVLDGLRGGSVSGLRMINSPCWFNLIANSSDVVVSDITISSSSSSSTHPKNTDGWNTYRSSAIVIQHSRISNNDDCVSLKPNSTDIVIQGLTCSGSHGISIGSLGQYADEFDIVEDVYVQNISMSQASDGARIKVWPGTSTSFQPNLNGGGGSGYVRNVTFDGIHNTGNDWAVELTQCYGQKDSSVCREFPSNMIIEDIVFKNMDGTTSRKHDPVVGTLVCSNPKRCRNIRVENITVKPPSGKTAQWTCTNIDKAQLNVNCV